MLACQGWLPDDVQDINLILVKCGHLITPPMIAADLNNRLYQKIYVCSSTVRATIKEVKFHYRPTVEDKFLDNLSAINVTQKRYSNADKPVWAVEKLGPEWKLSAIRPLWGIIDSNHLNNSDVLWKVHSEHLYLPAFSRAEVNMLGGGDPLVRAFLLKIRLMDVILPILGCYQRTRLDYELHI